MKSSVKVAILAAVASVAGVIVATQPALAVGSSCTSALTSWTSLGRCPTPNQNRGSVQGQGSLGTNGRNLLLTVTSGFQNVQGTARGFDVNGLQAKGPNGNCSVSASPGGPVFSASGKCNNGVKHQMNIAFNL